VLAAYGSLYGVDAVVQDLRQVGPILVRQRGQTPVIQDDQAGLGGGLQELDVAAIAVGDPACARNSSVLFRRWIAIGQLVARSLWTRLAEAAPFI
jgi:hypothetical protein